MSNKYGTGYDIIGDIHGYASELKALLNLLGYEEREGCYRHPERRVIFLGDFIDRGPEIRETLRIVRAMVERGHALAVMGNHEYNALCYHRPDGNGGHLRPHSDKNRGQHQATLAQIAVPFPDEWADHLDWFKSLPLYLELDGLRVVHACWDDAEIRVLKGCDRLTEDLLLMSAQRTTAEFRAIDVLLKGKEIRLPDGAVFTDKENESRREIRVKWWLDARGQSYHSISQPESETVPRTRIPDDVAALLGGGYGESELPVFVGHYWLAPWKPSPLARNVACLDYSVAKKGMLVAYRWDGERILDMKKMIFVSEGK